MPRSLEGIPQDIGLAPPEFPGRGGDNQRVHVRFYGQNAGIRLRAAYPYVHGLFASSDGLLRICGLYAGCAGKCFMATDDDGVL